MTNTRKPRGPAIKTAALVIFAVPWIALPVWMLLVNSFKPLSEASTLSVSLPRQWAAASNYSTVLSQWGLLTALRNSLVIIIPTLIAVMILGSLAAWAFARSRSRMCRCCWPTSSSGAGGHIAHDDPASPAPGGEPAATAGSRRRGRGDSGCACANHPGSYGSAALSPVQRTARDTGRAGLVSAAQGRGTPATGNPSLGIPHAHREDG
jgi:hypothetical protein